MLDVDASANGLGGVVLSQFISDKDMSSPMQVQNLKSNIVLLSWRCWLLHGLFVTSAHTCMVESSQLVIKLQES